MRYKIAHFLFSSIQQRTICANGSCAIPFYILLLGFILNYFNPSCVKISKNCNSNFRTDIVSTSANLQGITRLILGHVWTGANVTGSRRNLPHLMSKIIQQNKHKINIFDYLQKTNIIKHFLKGNQTQFKTSSTRRIVYKHSIFRVVIYFNDRVSG